MREKAKQMKSQRLTLDDALEQLTADTYVDRVATMNFWAGAVAGVGATLLLWWAS